MLQDMQCSPLHTLRPFLLIEASLGVDIFLRPTAGLLHLGKAPLIGKFRFFKDMVHFFGGYAEKRLEIIWLPPKNNIALQKK